MKKLKCIAKKYADKVGAAVLVLVATVGQASAALSTEEQSVLDAITTKVTDYGVPAFTVLASVMTFFIGLKWMKKVGNKVS